MNRTHFVHIMENEQIKLLDNFLKNKIIHDKENILGFRFGSLSGYISNLLHDINFSENTIPLDTLTHKFSDLNNKSSDYYNVFLNILTPDIKKGFSLYNIDKVSSVLNNIFKEWTEKAVEAGVDITREKNKLAELISSLKEGFDKVKLFESQIRIIDYDLNRLRSMEINRVNGEVSSLQKRILNKINAFIQSPEFIFNDDTFKYELGVNSLGLLQLEDQIQTTVINPIINKINEIKPNIIQTQADRYIAYQSNSSDIAHFLTNKQTNEDKVFNVELTKSQKYQELVLFKDNSIALKDNKNKFLEMNSHRISKSLIKDFYKSYVEFKLRKKPKYAALFIDKLITERYNLVSTLLPLDNLLKNEDILKNNGITFEKLQKIMPECSLEVLDDTFNEIIKHHKVKQYAHSITSNKYTHLFDENSYKIMNEIYDSKYPKEKLQAIIGKKIAAFIGSEDFNSALTKVLGDINGFNQENIIIKANNTGAIVVHETDNQMVVRIKDFEQSKTLGSPSWCISRTEYYFDQYTSNEKKQYFIFNFDKPSKDDESMIGLTLLENGSYYTAHVKDDSSLKMNDFLKDIQLTIIKNDRELYVELSAELQLEFDEKFKDEKENKSTKRKGLTL